MEQQKFNFQIKQQQQTLVANNNSSNNNNNNNNNKVKNQFSLLTLTSIVKLILKV